MKISRAKFIRVYCYDSILQNCSIMHQEDSVNILLRLVVSKIIFAGIESLRKARVSSKKIIFRTKVYKKFKKGIN